MFVKFVVRIVVYLSLFGDQAHCGSLAEKYFVLPRSSNTLPVVDIQEYPPNEYDPKEADLDPVKLRERLGLAYQTNFMSPTEPEPMLDTNDNHSPKLSEMDRFRPTGRMPQRIRKLNFDDLSTGKKRNRLSRKQKRRFQMWLWQATECSVVYKWKNLGHRFWPPWIKEGICDNSRSCSIPAGMACQPSNSMYITVLRWHCQGFNGNKMKYCTWIKAQYPTISECKCKC